MWNQRFAGDEYIYGEDPNEFVKQQLHQRSPGKVLFPAEGEGRNAVYAASLGWDVYAFDSSIEAQKKALRLANKKNVQINYSLASFNEANYNIDSFDLIILVFAHSMDRAFNHKYLLRFLKPKGGIILEGFSKKQIQNSTGGPPTVDLLFSVDELESDFRTLNRKRIWTDEVILNEGLGHKGSASVLRMIGEK